MNHWNFIVAAYFVGLIAFAWDWFAPALRLRALKRSLLAQQRRQKSQQDARDVNIEDATGDGDE